MYCVYCGTECEKTEPEFLQVLIDECPNCHAIWLDENEFQQILTLTPSDGKAIYKEGMLEKPPRRHNVGRQCPKCVPGILKPQVVYGYKTYTCPNCKGTAFKRGTLQFALNNARSITNRMKRLWNKLFR